MSVPTVVFRPLYHVPRSQVWPGSRGRQVGHVHLHFDKGGALCGRRGWYERPLSEGEVEENCPRCVKRATDLGIAWPVEPTAEEVGKPSKETERSDLPR